MKLKDLLEVIPDNYIITLMDADLNNYSTMCSGKKEKSIVGFGKLAEMPPAHVKNLRVTAIHPGVTTYLDEADMVGEDSTELHVQTQLLLELSTDEEESK